MRIAILGTRGIPNHYGGFEQFAENLSQFLVKKGHDVYVYNTHKHPYQEKKFNGVNIIHKYDPEHLIGTSGQFIYDLNCILDSRKRKYDVILQLGYTSSAIWFGMHKNNCTLITNMDGLEWKRSKYSNKVQLFLKKSERWAVSKSDTLVADSLGIQKYLKDKFDKKSTFIPYGASSFDAPNEKIVQKYELEKHSYDLLIARLEPENHVDVIIRSHLEANTGRTLLVIGGHNTQLSTELLNQYENHSNIRFLGGVYDIAELNNLRYYSNLYFHGHSVGGTNPSLLEAMSSSALIIAHNNIFNKAVLEENGFYFSSEKDLIPLIQKVNKLNHSDILRKNKEKISTQYSWDKINSSYLDLFERSCKK